ncbi:L-xylulose reductase-like [Agrilus planipennis]|uniref:L-xylulose reductase-like n=1 Tax=Agrilus planipennis TaxID=224129 RepID=A0A7F5RI01_AGRPL|nr:L-xylulose reductase-like [Agrilus planipennis]
MIPEINTWQNFFIKMDISFAGKQALVTGATSGIGKEITHRLVQCNAKVIAVGKNPELLSSLTKEFPSVTPVALDISEWENISNLNLSELGHIDLLVNCAGVSTEETITEITKANVDRQFDINTKSTINLTRMVASDLISRKVPGAIVNVSSQASMAGILGKSVYCASKGAVDAFTRAAALELGPHGIRVNSVNPTIVMTAMGRKSWSDPVKSAPMLARIPLGRFGTVEEVADAVVYLLSDRASLINGACLPVDGGFLAN